MASYGGDDLHAPATTGCDAADGAFAVVAPAHASAAFAPATTTAGDASALTFTITNPAANTVPLTGVALTTALPAGLVVASPNGRTGDCGGGTVTAVPGSGSVALSGGSVPVGGTCAFSVSVTAAQPGTRTVTTGAVQSGNGGAGDAASATLTTNEQPPPPPPPPPGGQIPDVPGGPAISKLRLGSHCVRPGRSGRVRVGLRMRLAEPGQVQIRFQRGIGSKALGKCPKPGSGEHFDGRYRTVETRESAAAASLATTVIAVEHRVRLKVRLKPGLYRVSVRAILAGGKLSAPERDFLRVLKRRHDAS